MRETDIGNVRRVSTTTRVTNLNAEYVCGLTKTDFCIFSGQIRGEHNINVQISQPTALCYDSMSTVYSIENGYPLDRFSGAILQLPAAYKYPCMIAGNTGTNRWFAKATKIEQGELTDWREFAFQDWVKENFVSKADLEEMQKGLENE